MKTTFNDYLNENLRTEWYRGYKYIKDPEKTPGEYGLWYIPDLYYRTSANKIDKGFKSVSMIQCREAIDEWYNFSEKVKKYKDDEEPIQDDGFDFFEN
jgi:hypothetical protein